MNFIVIKVPQSSTKTWCQLEFISRIISCMTNKFLLACGKWMSEGIHTFTETRKMRRATHAKVCDWVVRAWEAVKFLSIKNGFRKAGIASGTDDDASQTSNISDDKQITSTPILDPVLDAQLMDLFNSDTEDEDFNGFWTELTYHSSFNTCPSFLLTNQHGAEQSLAQNVATNSHSVKYEMLRFGYGPPVFLLYNFINKV